MTPAQAKRCRPSPWVSSPASEQSARSASDSRWRSCARAHDDPRPSTQVRLRVQAAGAVCEPRDVRVLDAGFGLTLRQEEGATRFVVRLAKNSTFRRRNAPSSRGQGRPPTRGTGVRPLPRTYSTTPPPPTRCGPGARRGASCARTSGRTSWPPRLPRRLLSSVWSRSLIRATQSPCSSPRPCPRRSAPVISAPSSATAGRSSRSRSPRRT